MHLTDFSCHVILVAVTAAVMSIIPILTSPSAAHACSCEPARDWGFLGPVHGRLPANAAGVLWFQPNEHILRNERLESRFTVEILERSTFRKLPVRVSPIDGFSDSFDGMYVVAPLGEGLQPGATYRFSGDRVGKTPGSGYRQVIVTIDRDTLSEIAAFTLEIGAVTNAVIEEAWGVRVRLHWMLRLFALKDACPKRLGTGRISCCIARLSTMNFTGVDNRICAPRWCRAEPRRERGTTSFMPTVTRPG